MSKIGKKNILIPKESSVKVENNTVTVSGLTAGTNTLIGNNIGANNKKKASLFVAQSIIFAIFFSDSLPTAR